MSTYITIRHTVADFAHWKQGFDAHAPVREQATLELVELLRGIEDPNEIMALFRVSDLDAARAMLASDELRQAMAKAGVTSAPTIYFGRTAGDNR